MPITLQTSLATYYSTCAWPLNNGVSPWHPSDKFSPTRGRHRPPVLLRERGAFPYRTSASDGQARELPGGAAAADSKPNQTLPQARDHDGFAPTTQHGGLNDGVALGLTCLGSLDTRC